MVAVLLRKWIANRARNLVQVSSRVKRKTGGVMMSMRGTGQGDALHLVDEMLSRGSDDEGIAEQPAAETGADTGPAADGLDQPLMTTSNSLASELGSSRREMPESLLETSKIKKRNFCVKILWSLIGAIVGAIAGWAPTSVPKAAAISSAGCAILGWYLASKTKKPHAAHELSSGDGGGSSDTEPSSQRPLFLFGDRQFAALSEGADEVRSIVMNMQAGDDSVVSIGLFENFNIQKAARYEVVISRESTRICTYKPGGGPSPEVEVSIEGDLLGTHDDPWVWITVHRGEIQIGSLAAPPPMGEGRPAGAQPLITCSDTSAALSVSHVAVRSWREASDLPPVDGRPGFAPSKVDWTIDIPGEPTASMMRLDTWAEFNQETFVARSIYVFLVFIMVSYVFLVSTAMQPWICFEDADNRQYLSADATVNCEPCHDEDIPPWLGGYQGLQVLSLTALIIYGVTIPSAFFWIVHKHREEVKSGPYLQVISPSFSFCSLFSSSVFSSSLFSPSLFCFSLSLLLLLILVFLLLSS